MKKSKLVSILCLSPLLFSLGGCAKKDEENMDPKPVDFVIISVHSNAVGCTQCDYIKKWDAEKYYDYQAGFDGVKIAYDCWTREDRPGKGPIYYSQNHSKDHNFTNIYLGQGNGLSTFGPEIGIGEELNESQRGKLFLVKYACGASNIKEDWTERDSPMYPRFINFIKLQMENLKKQGYIGTIKAFCWMQGEGDAYPGHCENNLYGQNLSKFVSQVREDLKEFLKDDTLPFIDATINNAPGVWPNPNEVNESKRWFEQQSENNYLIDTQEEGLHTDQEPYSSPDRAHYDSESQVKLGHLFAKAFKPFLS